MERRAYYARLKTADGDPISGFSKEEFDKIISQLDYRIAEKNDRLLYFSNEKKTVGTTKFYQNDYFEVFK